MIIQIIGLPASGKTTLIREYLKHNNDIVYLDFANYDGENRQHSCISDVKKSSKNIILESACGLSILDSKVILYKQPLSLIYKRHKNRDGYLDPDYLSLLDSYRIKPNYTISDSKALFSVLDMLFYKRR